MNDIFTVLTALSITLGGIFGGQALPDNPPEEVLAEEVLGAFGDPFISIQVATTSIAAGFILSSVDGVNNVWIANTGGGGDPNVILTDDLSTLMLRGSTTRLWQFPDGFIANASSTLNSNFNVVGAFSASSSVSIAGRLTLDDTTASRAVFTNSVKGLVTTGASADLLASLSDETGTALAVFSNSPIFTDDISLASAGILLTGANGDLTIAGIGDGQDENLIWNFNDTANVVAVTTGTSVATTTWSMGAQFDVLDIQSTSATSTFAHGIQLEGGTIRIDTLASCVISVDSGGLMVCGVPVSSNPTLTAANNLQIDTATSSVRFHDGSNSFNLFPDFEPSSIYASSTLDFDGLYGASGTTTYLLANYKHAVTLTDLFCKVNKGTVIVQIGTGLASSTISCTVAGVESTTDVAFEGRKDYLIGIGSQTGDPDLITVTDTIRQDE